LYCDNNQLTNLNISGCIALGYLDCGFNQITNLDITNNTALGYLDCISNQLTSLDVTNNTALEYLNCSLNKLRSLDVSDCNALIYLDCFTNRLTSLDVTNNTDLGYLFCSGNQITSLDVSCCIALFQLMCHSNQITSLNVSHNAALVQLWCRENQLTSLDVSKNTALEILDISFMPDLYEVCVWEMPFPPAGRWVDTTGSPNVYFTTDCLTNIQGDYKENSALNIYPNPSDDIINIEIENINQAIIEIYDVNGTLIFSKTIHSESEKIDISSISGGIYLVKVNQDSTVIIEKVVVR
jgi:Leucine-rich repeat (LRR) protein